MNNELIKHEGTQPTMLEIISNLVNQPGKVDVEALHRLLDFQERIEKRDAEREFVLAFNRLQSQLTPIAKNGKNAQGKPYATYEDAMRSVQPLLTENGFGVSIDEEEFTANGPRFALKLMHTAGHFTVTRRTFPMDTAATNREGKPVRPAIQDAGSTTQYAKRYLLFQALNLVAEGEDADGDRVSRISLDQATVLRDLIPATGMSEQRFLTMIAGTSSIAEILARDFGRCKNALETRKREVESERQRKEQQK